MKGKNVLVLGAARSGICSAELLLRHGAHVTVFDQNEKIDRDAFFAHFTGEEKPELIIGEFPQKYLTIAELAVISPGIPLNLPFVEDIVAAGIPLWG